MRKGAEIVLVFVSPLRVRMKYSIHLHFPGSNNVDEYGALVNGLKIAIELGIHCIEVRRDSQLVVDQIMIESSCESDIMSRYC